MISVVLLALASPVASAPQLSAGYAPDTIRHLKGHPSLPAGSATGPRTAAAAATCHPDPNKGRACRHHHAKAEEANRDSQVLAEAGEDTGDVAAR